MSTTYTGDNQYILTFGYGNRKDYQSFIEYLQKYDVKYVIDVRINPRAWSRKWYGEQINNLCKSKNIQYVSKTSLGNTSGKENWIPPDPKKADADLEEIAKIAHQAGTILLLCAEMNPHRCHRRDVATCLSKLISRPIEHLE